MKQLLLLLTLLVPQNSNAVRIDVNTRDAPDLKPFGDEVKTTLERWYPYLSGQLRSPTFEEIQSISLYFDPNYNGVAYVLVGKIVGAVKYYIGHPNDVGSMIHEMVHVIQGYRNNPPSWLTEGIADYWRNYKYEGRRLPKPTRVNNYTDSYRITAYFLNWVEERNGMVGGGRTMVYWLNKECREGTYNDNIWPRFLGKTVQQLWEDMMNDSRAQ